MSGVTDPSHAVHVGLFTLPEFVWELFLGIYLTFKGFKPSPIMGETSPALS
jgi:hypothetical protein